MQFTLSNDQRRAKEGILPILRGKTEHKVALLNGYAGTGKTFLVADILSELCREGRDVLALAPTHKAVAVLHEKFQRAGLEIDCMTMHRALGVKMRDTGVELQAVFTGRSLLVNYRAIVVDEGSMINRTYFDRIMSDAKSVGAAVLFVGDLAQLPPVGDEGLSPVFTDVQTQFTLTEIQRQSVATFEVPLMGQKIRLAIEEGRRININELYEFKRGIEFVPRRSVLDPELSQYSIATQYAISAIKQGLNAKILAFSNTAVERNNSDVQKYFNADARKFRVGEPVVFAEQYSVDYPNNSEWEVESCSETTTRHGVECAMVKLKGAPDEFMVPFHADVWLREINGLRRDLRSIKGFDVRAMRPIESRIKELRQFANIRACYASTVHKSQGSTYDVAIVDWDDLTFCQDGNLQLFNRLAYVAITRPSQYLIVIN